MQHREIRRRGVGVLLALAAVVAAAEARSQTARVLVVTYSAGFEHEVVRRPAPDQPSTVERVLAELGHRSGRFDITTMATRDDLRHLTASAVRAHQAVLFFTTGELPIAADARGAIFASVREGGGFIGIHSAADTWYDVPEYGKLLGGHFDGHPWHQRARLLVEDTSHPATQPLGPALEITDEIYQFRQWSRRHVHVLLRLDPDSVDITRGKRRDGDYAIAWSKPYGRGRVFYTALGHEPAMWADPRVQAHVLGGIVWALGAKLAAREPGAYRAIGER